MRLKDSPDSQRIQQDSGRAQRQKQLSGPDVQRQMRLLEREGTNRLELFRQLRGEIAQMSDSARSATAPYVRDEVRGLLASQLNLKLGDAGAKPGEAGFVRTGAAGLAIAGDEGQLARRLLKLLGNAAPPPAGGKVSQPQLQQLFAHLGYMQGAIARGEPIDRAALSAMLRDLGIDPEAAGARPPRQGTGFQGKDGVGQKQTKEWAAFFKMLGQSPQAGLKRAEGDSEQKRAMELLGKGEASATPSSVSLRSPVRAGAQIMSPAAKALMMKLAFGSRVSSALAQRGIDSPQALVQNARTPGARAELASALGMSRGQLMNALCRAQLLGIGPGRRGEVGIKPQHLAALLAGGVATSAQMAALTGSKAAFEAAYKAMRRASGSLASAMAGERPILRKDVMHWSKAARKHRSDFVFAENSDEWRERGNAEELIQLWYLQTQLEADEEQKRQRWTSPDEDDDDFAFEDDEEREDGLVCFWIDTPKWLQLEGDDAVERLYVCIDPESGAVIPQSSA